jgi:cytochrome c peroxidase
VAFLQRFFWDGRASSLEEQMQGPLFAAAEMGTTPEKLVHTLRDIPAYRALFEVAFPRDDGEAIDLPHIYTAIAAFEASLVSLGSRYDHYANGDARALSPAEIEGFNVFRSFVARCAECHTPPLFTNQQIAVIGVPNAEGRPFDPGAAAVFDNPTWRGGFKVPALRNIASTAPYMHSGQFATLREAAKFYNGGRGHAVPDGETLVLHWHIWNPELREDELDRLVDFMNALTDETTIPEIPARVPSGLPPVAHDTPPITSAKGSER